MRSADDANHRAATQRLRHLHEHGPDAAGRGCTSTARFRVGGAEGQNCASAIACNAVPATDGSAAASAAESALGVLRHWLAGTSSRDEYGPKERNAEDRVAFLQFDAVADGLDDAAEIKSLAL